MVPNVSQGKFGVREYCNDRLGCSVESYTLKKGIG